MTKPLKNNNRNLVILIIIWALVLALTLIGVYMYYDQKIEQLQQSIDEQSETVGYRMGVLPVSWAIKIPSREGKSEDSKAKPVESNEGCVHGNGFESDAQPYQRPLNIPLLATLNAPPPVPSPRHNSVRDRQEGIPKTIIDKRNKQENEEPNQVSHRPPEESGSGSSDDIQPTRNQNSENCNAFVTARNPFFCFLYRHL